VLRESDPQTTSWELLLPEEAKRLPAELARIDAYLDDERFIAPWRVLFSKRLGRPSVPIDTLLRLLYLKHPLWVGLPEPVSRSQRLDRVAAVLPHRPGSARAASHHADQAGGSRRPRGGPGAERRPAREAGRRPVAARPQAADRHHRGRGRHRRPDRRRPAGACGQKAGWAGPAGQGSWRGQPHSGSGPWPGGRPADEAAGARAAPADRGGDGGGGPAHRRGRGDRQAVAWPGPAGGAQRPPDAGPSTRGWAAGSAGR
jgi:hypothetical protein